MVSLLFACKISVAQNPYIQRYSITEGLPSNSVYTVFQDSKKFIWFATDAGVARFDGTRFTYFRKQDGLSSNDVFEIKEDSFGRIWFFHINASLNYIADNQVYNEKNTPFLDSLKGSYFCKKFYEDTDKNIYFFDNPQRIIYCLSPKNRVTRYQMPSMMVKSDLKSQMFEAMTIRYLEKDVNGEFLFLSPMGILRSKTLSGNPKIESNEYLFSDILSSSNKTKYAVVRKKGNNLFELKRFKHDLNFTNIKPFPSTGSEFIFSVLEDNNGILWISTYDKGVFCFRGDSLIYHLNIKNALTLLQDHENNIWLCSLKDGAYKISPNITRHKHFGTNIFQNNGISSLCRKDSTSIWLTEGRMIYALANNELYKLDFQKSENSFDEILQVNKNNLLVGETSKYPFALEGITIDVKNHRIRCDKISQSPIRMKKIISSPEKNEVSSYNQFSIYIMNPANLFREIKTYRIEERIYSSYYNNSNALILNAKNPYVHNNGTSVESPELEFFRDKLVTDHLNLNTTTELFNIEGVSLYLFFNKKIINLSEKLDQPIHFNIKHLFYHDSVLYIASPRNIYVCKNPLNAIIGKEVQLQMIDISFRSINDIEVNNNKLYVASDDGLTEIPVEEIYSSNDTPPIPYILSIKVNDIENNLNNNQIKFTGHKRINIAFTGINYSISPITFSYKLEGADTTWTISRSNEVVLQNLSSGQYKFKLRTKKPDSEWSKPVDISIIVQATVWQHPLFYFLIVLFFIGLIFLLILRQKNIQLRHQEVTHQMILLEQKSLQAMMNPHFIFNSLGSIQNYLLHNKPYEAGIYLSQFARLIRQNLNSIDTSMINLEEEVSRIKNYLDLEKLRLGEKFDYSIVVNEGIESDDISIPSMIIQPLVENAIWHGIALLEGNGYVLITFELNTHNTLRIIIEDSGIGVENSGKYNLGQESHLNLGMSIIRKRLNLLSKKYGIGTGITISEYLPGSVNPGTRVVLIVPFIFGKPATSS